MIPDYKHLKCCSVLCSLYGVNYRIEQTWQQDMDWLKPHRMASTAARYSYPNFIESALHSIWCNQRPKQLLQPIVATFYSDDIHPINQPANCFDVYWVVIVSPWPRRPNKYSKAKLLTYWASAASIRTPQSGSRRIGRRPQRTRSEWSRHALESRNTSTCSASSLNAVDVCKHFSQEILLSQRNKRVARLLT